MSANFWSYLLDGLVNVFQSFLEQFPNASSQADQLFALIPTSVTQVIEPFYFWVSPIIELRLLGVLLVVILVLETVRAGIAIWRWILSLIPAAS